jgi:hypothetical protein
VLELLRLILTDKTENPSDPAYLYDRLQVGFREYPF